MTIKTITAQLDHISEDSWYDVNGNRIDLTIHDFEGFDSDWSEIYREFIDEDAVGEVLDWLEKTGRNYPIRIHSMNPVGVENMRRIIQRNGWTEVR